VLITSSKGIESDVKRQSYIKASLEDGLALCEAMKMEGTIDSYIETVVNIFIEADPSLIIIRGTMIDFMKKYFNWDRIKNEYAEIYVDRFSKEELQELTEFYKTPVGQKYAILGPLLAEEGGKIGQRIMDEHLGEFQLMIIKEMMNSY